MGQKLEMGSPDLIMELGSLSMVSDMRPKSSTIGATLVKAHSDSMCAFLDLHSNTLIIRQEACFIPTAAVGQQESRGRNHSHIVCLSGFSRLLNTCAPVADQARSTLYCLSAPLLHCTGFFGTKSSLIRSLLCLRVGFHPTHNGKTSSARRT